MPDAMNERKPAGSIAEVFAAFLKLGLTSFGGPIAHLGYFRAEFVERRKWLSESDPRLEPFAIAAATLARVRKDAGSGSRPGATARQLGAPRSEGGAEPLYAETRFKRLLRCRDDWPDLLAQARRVAAILEREAPIGDLGASLVLWNADPSIRKHWAFQYYAQRDFESAADDDPPAPTLPTSVPATN